MQRLGDIVAQEKLRTGGAVCKVATVRSCCEKRTETKLCKSRQNSLTVAIVLENNLGQVVEKPSDLFLCLFGFVKAAKFRYSSEHLQYIQTVLAKSCLPCQMLYKPNPFC